MIHDHVYKDCFPESIIMHLVNLLSVCVCVCVFKVRAVCGSTYMLDQDEELWEKVLPPAVEQLLSEARDPLADRGTRSSRCPACCVLL